MYLRGPEAHTKPWFCPSVWGAGRGPGHASGQRTEYSGGDGGPTSAQRESTPVGRVRGDPRAWVGRVGVTQLAGRVQPIL